MVWNGSGNFLTMFTMNSNRISDMKESFGVWEKLYSAIAAFSFVLNAALGQVDVPVDAQNRLNDIVTGELKGQAVGFVGDARLERISGYEGAASMTEFEFIYQVFPALGVYRIVPTKQNGDRNWLYMPIGKINPEQCVRVDENGGWELDEGFRDRVLICASGILYRDVTMAKLSCRQLPNHYLYTQEVKAFVSGVSAVRLLVDPKHHAIAVDSSNHWRNMPENGAGEFPKE